MVHLGYKMGEKGDFPPHFWGKTEGKLQPWSIYIWGITWGRKRGSPLPFWAKSEAKRSITLPPPPMSPHCPSLPLSPPPPPPPNRPCCGAFWGVLGDPRRCPPAPHPAQLPTSTPQTWHGNAPKLSPPSTTNQPLTPPPRRWGDRRGDGGELGVFWGGVGVV